MANAFVKSKKYSLVKNSLYRWIFYLRKRLWPPIWPLRLGEGPAPWPARWTLLGSSTCWSSNQSRPNTLKCQFFFSSPDGFVVDCSRPESTGNWIFWQIWLLSNMHRECTKTQPNIDYRCFALIELLVRRKKRQTWLGISEVWARARKPDLEVVSQ